MKKKQILLTLCFMSLLLCNCSKREDELLDGMKIPEKTYLPAHIEEYGKRVAIDLHNTVKKLSLMGVDYSNANSSSTFKDQFFNDFYEASPTKNKSAKINSKQLPSKVFAERVNNLTQIQIEFIERIIKECDKSESYTDLAKRLVKVNKEIYSEVPEIQQERLFTITAVLYYGVKEIQNLEEQGLMPRTPQSNMQPLRLKSGNESGDNIGATCRKFLATTWTIAIGEPTPAGEIVAAIATVVVGGILLYEIVTCAKTTNPDIDHCIAMFESCDAVTPNFPCDDCLHFCRSNGYWDFVRCPR